MTNLSHGGRLALIRSVLQATPLHLLQGSYNGRKHIHWSSWAKTCFPVAEGGLGVRSLADYVRAFSMKLWWRFRGKSSLWSEYLHGRYCRNMHSTIVPYNRNHSSVWHRLCRIRDVAEPFIFWILGEGSVSFWHNNWFGEKSLAQLLHRGTYTMEPQARGIKLCGRGLVRGISQRNQHGKLFDKLHLGGSYLLMSGTVPCGQLFQFSCGGYFKIEFQWTRECDKRGSVFHLNRNAAKYRGVPFSTDGIILEVQCHLRTLVQCAGRAHNRLGGLELALTHGLAPLVVEVDATTVISLLKSRASGKWEVQHMIMRIVCLQQLLVADVQHVFREANGAADHLAKEAASLQLTLVLHHDDITGILRDILCLDRQGVPHLR
ncbi:UNVERIFIED_CONTAM: hypothetical protein Scaly_1915900 [Sesamum calycinum]|uniref:RNase H type-1 domain-containing protein n=1 Tax=Sesamum calycinum TaxID=2727403 RepID=A0AAW2NHR9_9LAMI